MRMKRIISIALMGCVMATSSCGQKPANVVDVDATPQVTKAPKMFEGDIKQEIEELSIMKGTNVYDNLSVTGKKLGVMDIYLDKTQDKYVVICGQSLVYLPIDKDGVVKLKSGIHKYWDESRLNCNYVYIGKDAEKLEKNNENENVGELSIYLNGYRCDTISCWKSESGMNVIDLESLCNALGLKFKFEDGCAIIRGLNDKMKIVIDGCSQVTFNDYAIDCIEVENIKTKCIVGSKFLRDVLGLEVMESEGSIELEGVLVPNVILLENYTATGALKKPFDGNKKSGLALLKVFGEYDQSQDIAQGLVRDQVFYRNY